MNKLENKVLARNSVNTLARESANKIRVALSPFVGQKIVLASGGFSHKFAKAVTAAIIALNLPSDARKQVYISSGHGYTLTANFRVTIVGDGCTYGEVTVYLFDLKNGVLVENVHYLTHTDHLHTDYTAAAIMANRERVKVERSALQAAESSLAGFGEYDQ